MKKYLVRIPVVLMALAMVACGGNKQGGETAESSGNIDVAQPLKVVVKGMCC